MVGGRQTHEIDRVQQALVPVGVLEARPASSLGARQADPNIE